MHNSTSGRSQTRPRGLELSARLQRSLEQSLVLKLSSGCRERQQPGTPGSLRPGKHAPPLPPQEGRGGDPAVVQVKWGPSPVSEGGTARSSWGARGREQAASNVLSQRSSFATLGRNVKRKLDSERKKITGILGK